MPEEEQETSRTPRGFWSGTLSFGLVSVPVSLFVATRSSRPSLRMVDEQGTPLARRYVCSRDEAPLTRDDIVRGYEIEKDRFVLVEDEELEAIAPEKSQEIDLERFVPLAEIDPVYFERAYFLAPGKGGARPYRLLARAMEDSGRAGIATFVMRGKEYLVAIIAERGILRAETLRFHDELRRPADVGLPELAKAEKDRVRQMAQAIKSLEADEVDRAALSDQQTQRLEQVVERKLAAGADVIEAPEEADSSERESAEVIDLMQVLKQSLQETDEDESAGKGPAAKKRRATPPRKGPKASTRRGLESRSKTELYQQAQELDIAGRSSMTKDELIDAIGKAQ